jgi:hypothetical protein
VLLLKPGQLFFEVGCLLKGVLEFCHVLLHIGCVFDVYGFGTAGGVDEALGDEDGVVFVSGYEGLEATELFEADWRELYSLPFNSFFELRKTAVELFNHNIFGSQL